MPQLLGFRNNMILRFIGTLSLRESINNNFSAAIRRAKNKMTVLGPTAEDIAKDISLANKTCLITGANNGIGLEVARCLNSRDCNVLMACRNTYEASVAAKNVCQSVDKLKFYELNLASLNSVRNCCESLLGLQKNIDIVILNAATFGLPWTLTEDGLETTFQVNFLSQYYLLLSLEKILAPNARVVFTSSESHRNVKLPDDALVAPTIQQLSLPRDTYTSICAYNLSKLCGVLAMRYLHYRWLNSDKAVFCAHPGTFVKTGLCRNWWVFEALYTLMKPFSKSVSQAASTVVFCAISPALRGHSGLYFKDCRLYDESDLGKDTYLSFRIHDLVCDVLRERNIDCNNFINEKHCKIQNERYEEIVSNC